MNLAKIAIGISMLIFIFSCNQKPGENLNQVEVSEISALQSIAIDISEQEFPVHTYQLSRDKDHAILYGLDVKNYMLHQYDLQQARIVNSFPIKAKELDLDEPAQFYLHNSDSIFMIDVMNNELYLMNSQGEIYEEWELDLIFPNELDRQFKYISLSAVYHFNLPFFYNPVSEKIIVGILCYDDDGDMTEFFRHPVFTEIQLTESPQEVKLWRDFPKSYLADSIPYDLRHVLTLTKDNVVVSFGNSDSCYFKNENKFVRIKSKYDQGIFPTYTRTALPENQESTKILNTYAAYENLVYDPFQNRLLRVYRHEQSQTDKDGLLNEAKDAVWSLIDFSLDSMSITKEWVMQGNSLDYRYIFPTQEGLLVQEYASKKEQKLKLKWIDL